MVPFWLSIIIGVLSALVAVVTLLAAGRAFVHREVASSLNEVAGPVQRLLAMEEKWHRIEQHVFNGLTEEVNRTGQQVTDIRVMMARLEEHCLGPDG